MGIVVSDLAGAGREELGKLLPVNVIDQLLRN
jgi:hypothetical protein